MTGELQSIPGVEQEQDVNAIGAGCECCAGRREPETETETETETGPETVPAGKSLLRRTVKGKMRLKGHRHKKNAGGVAGKGKQSGQHVPRGTSEAAEILSQEGYTVGKVLDPESPFDLMGWNHGGSILVRVARPKEPVANARDVGERYETDIRAMEPYYRSEADNIQFMIFSRESGLLRYRVYDWGIGNVRTMQKIMKSPRAFPSDTPITGQEPANRRARNSPCPDEQAGLVSAPDAISISGLYPCET